MSYLLIILIILVVVLYGQYYASYKTDYKINQTYLSNINVDILYEKYPVIIYDRLVEPENLLSTLFKYNYLTKYKQTVNTTNPILLTSKYTIVYNKANNILLNVISPKFTDTIKWTRDSNYYKSSTSSFNDLDHVQYITVKLSKMQVIIMPFKWIVHSNQDYSIICLDDIFSSINKYIS